MRIDLRVPFAEKNDAKLLGARWDQAKKVWYIINKEDLTPFVRWMSKLLLPAAEQKKKPARQPPSGPRQTPCTNSSLPNCSCIGFAPWDNCACSEKVAEA